MPLSRKLDRRHFLGGTTSAMIAATANSLSAAKPKRIRVAAVLTEFTYRSHAHVILENFLKPYYFNGNLTEPGMDVVSLYVDQFPSGDMAREAAKTFGFKIYPTIAEALCQGGDRLAVDGVLSIGEHGNYPTNKLGQRMYPRKRFFDQIVAVFRRSGRVVPLFNDKHLSYRWDWAQEMMDVAEELKIPFLAGSSVPLAQRRPLLELPDNSIIEEAVSIHSGGLESYDFHAMEVLQSIVESRRGGESGVRTIQLLEGDDVWQAADAGRWSLDLAAAAMKAQSGKDVGDLRQFVEPADGKKHPVHAILIEYRDRLRATILRLGHSSTRWNFACRLAEETTPRATSFYVGPWQNRNLFKALAHAIQVHIRKGNPPYPVERTALVTGMLASAMQSRFQGHSRMQTPHLDLAYSPRDFKAMREMGDSWKILTEGMPEPPGIDPGRP